MPAAWAHLFRSPAARAALATHRGSDPGALAVARQLARATGAPLVATEISRLLVEVNRSPGHPRLWSDWSAGLDAEERERVLDAFYRPHRAAVAAMVEEALRGGGVVLHVGVHSFTPVLGGEVRNADVGLLYDPRRGKEREFAHRWRDALRAVAPALRVRRNYPYLGRSDGLVTDLRRRIPPDRYLGLELEMNQAMVAAAGRERARMAEAVVRSLKAAVSTGVE